MVAGECAGKDAAVGEAQRERGERDQRFGYEQRTIGREEVVRRVKPAHDKAPRGQHECAHDITRGPRETFKRRAE